MSPTLDRRRAIVSLAGIGVAGFASARAVSAQGTAADDVSATENAAIVVTATGSASSPATRAIAQLILRAQYDAVPVEAEVPKSVPQAPAIEPTIVDAVVESLVEAGLDQPAILTGGADQGFGGGFFGPGSAVVVFQLEGEQIKTLKNLLTVATEKASELGVMFDQPGAMYLADSCQDLRGDAYADAVETGAEEAGLLADAMGVALGELSQARKQSVTFGPAAYGFTSSDACDDLVDLGTAVRSYLPPYDATLPNEFIVYAMVELTFSTN